jgi:hypothetical protein
VVNFPYRLRRYGKRRQALFQEFDIRKAGEGGVIDQAGEVVLDIYCFRQKNITYQAARVSILSNL